MTRLLLVLVFAGTAIFAETPSEIVAKAAQNMLKANRKRDDYTYKEKSVIRELTPNGTVKKTQEEEKEITVFAGKEVERTIEKNGKPLPENEARKEQEKIDKAAREASHLSPEQVKERLDKRDREFAKDNEWLTELPSAFNFTLAGEQALNGGQVYVIDGVPKPDYKGKDAHLFHCVTGKLYIDKQSYTLVEMDGEFRQACSFGLFLAKLQKGTKMHFERVLVNDEVWLPKEVTFIGEGRALFKRVDADAQIVYSDYKKFTADSRIVSTSDVPVGGAAPSH